MDNRDEKERLQLIDKLNKAESERKRIKNMMYELPVGVAVIRGGNTLVVMEANEAFCKMTGYTVQEAKMEQNSILSYFYEDDGGILEDAVETVRTGGKSEEFEARIQDREGKIHWGVFQCQIFYYKDALPYYVLTSWDVTGRKNLEDELRVLGERYRLLEDVTDEAPMDYNVSKRKFRVPMKYQSNRSEMADGMVDLAFVLKEIHEDDREEFARAIETAAFRETSGTMDFRLRRKLENGEYTYHWYRAVYRSVLGQDQKIAWVIGKTYDISEDKQKEEKMSEEMQLDPLTRLYNKVAIGKEVDHFLSVKPNGTHVLFLIDIDNFKKVNDTFGHTVGDTVIFDIASQIQDHFRSTDIVGRVGGDEFVVFMKNTSIEDATGKAELLCKNISKSLYGDGEELTVTLSVGMSVYGKHGQDYASLFEKADDAMYQIKNNGKNFYTLADENAIDTLNPRKEVQINDMNGRKKADAEFLSLAFSLLSHAKDMNASLNVLLEQIGKRFRLNMVSVFELEDEHPQMLLTNCWSNIGQIYEKNVLPVTWTGFDKIETGVFIRMNELRADGATEEICDLENWNIKREKIRSMAAVKFEFSNGRVGCMDIGSTEPNMIWSQEDAETLCELSRVIGVFVSLRNRLREDQQTLHKLKHRDALTGLYNVDTFKTKVSEELKSCNPEDVYALVHVDVNHFSYINENFGQVTGDQILSRLARLLETKGQYQLFSCRLYSDYFISLLKASSKEEIIASIATGNQKFEAEYKKKYPAGSISLSTGICFTEGSSSLETLLEGANLARKYAKEQNISTGVVYEKYMRQKRDDLLRISSQFYGAIQKGEFEIFLQPKFLLGERKVYGAEALARWRLEDGRIITPDRFIPALESLGYIVDLDFCIFEQLLRIMKRWMDAGKQLITVSTNFSRKNFENGGQEFIDRIKTIMDRYPVPAEFIEIEVTENVVVENIESLRHCMNQLAEIGFRIAIDDFGTGYSSLNVLLEIPANVIKMDKTFTRKLDQKRQRQFVSRMGLLIKAAKEEVIFEGIETDEQEKFLKSSGFKYGQGYLVDQPIPVEEFEKKYL